MKKFLITLLVIDIIQILFFLGALISDAVEDEGDNNFITSKRDVLKFLIPFFWFVPMVVAILTWWKKLP